MKIKNLTPLSQELKVAEIVGGREFTISVEGNGYTDLVGTYIPNLKSIDGIFEIVKEGATLDISIDDEIDDNNNEEEQEDSTSNGDPDGDEDGEQEEDKPAEDTEEGKFICDVCGAEFASARGLASHKNRVHNDKEE